MSSGDGELKRYPHEDARDFSQRRAFLGYLNYILRGQDADPISDPITDLTDGVALSIIYTGITGKELKGIDLKPKNNKMKCISNLTIVLQALNADGLLLTNVGPQDIYDQNYSLIMGFLWKVVRKYHVGMDGGKSGSGQSEESDEDRIRREMIGWTNRRMEMIGEQLRVTNLTSDFQDGKVMTAIVASYDASFLSVHKQELSSLSRMRRAFAQSQVVCAVPAILSAVDVHQNPDEKSIMMYLAFFMKLDEQRRTSAKGMIGMKFTTSASFSEGVGASSWSTSPKSFQRARVTPSGEQRSVQIGNVGQRNQRGSGIKADSRDRPAGFLDTPPPISAPRLPTRKKVFNMKDFTFKVIETPTTSYVGQSSKFTVHMSPTNPDTFADKSQMHDALPVTQIKILSGDDRIPPNQIQYYGFSEAHKAGIFGIEFYPTSAGQQVLQLLDANGNIVFSSNLRDCLDSNGMNQNDLSSSDQYSSSSSRFPLASQGGTDERAYGASSNSIPNAQLSYGEGGEGEGFSYMTGERMEMMSGAQAGFGRMETSEENLSRTGKQSRISFYSGNSGVPMRKSVTPFNFDVKDLQDEIEKELEEGQKSFEYQKQQKPSFARTTTLSDTKLLKVFLDDDPELDEYGLRQACITVKYEGMGMRAAQLKETVKTKMCSKLDKAAEMRLREYVQYFVVVELTKSGEHRIVGKCEPLGRWEVGLCPPDSRLMFLPIMGHFEFVVDYPLTRVALGENFYVRIEVTDPFRLNKPVKTHNGYLAVVCTSKAGVQTEYEVHPVEGEDGVHTACWQYNDSGRYHTMVQFNGHDIQSRPAIIKVGKGKPMLRMKGLKTVHHKKKEQRDLASSGPSFPKSFHDDQN